MRDDGWTAFVKHLAQLVYSNHAGRDAAMSGRSAGGEGCASVSGALQEQPAGSAAGKTLPRTSRGAVPFGSSCNRANPLTYCGTDIKMSR